MRKTIVTAAYCILIVALVSAICAEPLKVSPEDAKAWISYTVPLPQSIEITGKVRVPLASVAIVPPANTDQITSQLLSELNESFGLTPGAQPASKPEFTLKLEIGGPDSESLKSLKNSDQASRIFAPAGVSNELRIVALTPRGLYYAAKTLQQLVLAKKADGFIEIPLLNTTDWPDMEERGLWGADPYRYGYLGWMGGLKINVLEQICNCGVDDSGKAFALLAPGKESLLNEGPRYGIKFVPVILHLEQGKPGVFKAHPEYKAVNSNTDSFCYSQPGVVDLLSDWMVQFASLPNVTSVDAWMTENLNREPGCQCDGCKTQDRNMMEFKAIIQAWEKTKSRLGRDFGLYVLTSEETERSIHKILADLPKDVKLWYYHSLFTYNTTEDPIARPYLGEAANAGSWIGICPNLCSIVEFYQPFTSPQFARGRMNEFVDKKLAGVLGFPAPLISFVKFAIEGEAEWSWNAKGRTPYDFAYSYAVRTGIRNPALFAEWTDTVGPVSWDIYGSAFPSGETRGIPEVVATRLKKGTLDDLGFVLWETYNTPWGDIKTVKQLNDDVAAAAKGLELARKLGIREYWYESLMIDGYMKSLKALYELKQIVKSGAIADVKKDEAKGYFEMYVNGLAQAKDALPKWEHEVDAGANRAYAKKPTAFMDTMIDQMRKTAEDLGVTVARPS